MSKTDKQPPTHAATADSAAEPPSLAAASAALEAELERFEDLAAAAKKIPLNTHKNLERAAKMTRDAAESQERFGGHLRSLVDAVASARDRQQAAADAINARADEIQTRSSRFEELMKRFAGLGAQAGSINEMVQRAAALKRDAQSPEAVAEVVTVLGDVQSSMTGVVDEAADLAKTATAEGMDELSRQADSLRQQVLAARNRLNLLHQSLKASTN